MLCLLSPAKKLVPQDILARNRKNKDSSIADSKPYFVEQNALLAAQMKQKTSAELEKLMGISPKLAALNHQRYQEIAAGTASQIQAIFGFAGDVYQHLGAEDFTDADIAFAQEHLRILSGFYGLLRPLDLMAPYRLEMGIALPIDGTGAQNLYDFWGDKIAPYLEILLENHIEKTVLNLASNEYSKAVKIRCDSKLRIIHVGFRQRRGNQLKNIGLLAKRARGTMARHIIREKIDKPDNVKDLRFDNYRFDESVSDKNLFTFIQEET